LVGLA